MEAAFSTVLHQVLGTVTIINISQQQMIMRTCGENLMMSLYSESNKQEHGVVGNYPRVILS